MGPRSDDPYTPIGGGWMRVRIDFDRGGKKPGCGFAPRVKGMVCGLFTSEWLALAGQASTAVVVADCFSEYHANHRIYQTSGTGDG